MNSEKDRTKRAKGKNQRNKDDTHHSKQHSSYCPASSIGVAARDTTPGRRFEWVITTHVEPSNAYNTPINEIKTNIDTIIIKNSRQRRMEIQTRIRVVSLSSFHPTTIITPFPHPKPSATLHHDPSLSITMNA
jgi:hypothetical protein